MGTVNSLPLTEWVMNEPIWGWERSWLGLGHASHEWLLLGCVSVEDVRYGSVARISMWYRCQESE